MRALRQSARRLSSAAKSPRDAVIVGVARTPVGGFNGSLAALKAPELGSAAIAAALDRAGVPKESVEQCWMGNVIASGMGQAPARQAAQMAGLPDSTCCTTVNKVCSSGMKAVTLGSQEIVLGNADVLVAGGMESMSNVPYYVPKARFGARMGDATMVDGLVFDGLWDPYDNCHMGGHAELCAETHGITREMQDAHADESYRRARAGAAYSEHSSSVSPPEPFFFCHSLPRPRPRPHLSVSVSRSPQRTHLIHMPLESCGGQPHRGSYGKMWGDVGRCGHAHRGRSAEAMWEQQPSGECPTDLGIGSAGYRAPRHCGECPTLLHE
mmetsp:Transcript_42738/g.142214  ORF Transcript_42738/g.142214 Transcript_42738/m.142214 type:complete len:325 (+) Transcript_42738:30-1004(+)